MEKKVILKYLVTWMTSIIAFIICMKLLFPENSDFIVQKIVSNPQNESRRLERSSVYGTKMEYLLTIFTTYKDIPSRLAIQQDSAENWASLTPKVNVIVYSTDANVLNGYVRNKVGPNLQLFKPPKTNENGLPLVKDMYTHLLPNHANATFMGFSNGDILFDASLQRTLLAIDKYLDFPGAIMVTSTRRTILTENNVSFHPQNQELLHHVYTTHGVPGLKVSGDYYFMKNAHLFPWHKMEPKLVFGRIHADPYFFGLANDDANTAMVDATDTIMAFHHRGKDGENTSHRVKGSDGATNTRNLHIGRGYFKHNMTIKAAKYYTGIGPDARIWVKQRV